MTEISGFVDPIVAAIYSQHEKRGNAEQPRAYLGGSIIGKECERALWYDFRWATRVTFDGRMHRLFQTGHLAEPRFVADLRSIGATVWDCDPATGRQFGYEDLHGHMRGNVDAVAVNIPTGGQTPHLVEMKTHSLKSFEELKKSGVKKAKPQHYAQMTVYMGWANLTRGLYMAVNKNTDELYSERIEFDRVEFEKLIARGERVIFAPAPPPRLRDDPKYFVCNWCDHAPVCHGNRVPPVSCRTCVHSTPERTGGGAWSCAKHGSEIPLEHQRTGCDQHLPLPFLLTYAEPLDAGDGWVEFRRLDTKAEFVVATPGARHPYPVFPIYSSQEISAAADHRAIADPEIEKIRMQFPGSTICG